MFRRRSEPLSLHHHLMRKIQIGGFPAGFLHYHVWWVSRCIGLRWSSILSTTMSKCRENTGISRTVRTAHGYEARLLHIVRYPGNRPGDIGRWDRPLLLIAAGHPEMGQYCMRLSAVALQTRGMPFLETGFSGGTSYVPEDDVPVLPLGHCWLGPLITVPIRHADCSSPG